MSVNYVIQNKVSEQDFEQIVYKWLSEGDYTPDDIIENIITQNNAIWMPVYYFRVDYNGSCSVNLGYQEQEFYSEYDYSTKQYVRKSRWVTRWKPHSQPTRGTAYATVYVGEPVPDKIISFIEDMGWAAEELIEVEHGSQYYSKVVSLFQYSKQDAWKNRAYEKVFMKAAQQTSKELPSMLQRNLVLNIDFTEKLFFSFVAPYWLFNYKYNEKQYYVAVDGNDPSRIDGIKPEDKKRKNSVIKLRWFGWLTGLLAVLIALYIFSGENLDETFDANWGNFGIVAAGIIFTWVLVELEVRKIKNKSYQIRKKSLDSKVKMLKESGQ
jgi:hypothetical protein